MKNILKCMVFVVGVLCVTNAWAGSATTVNVSATVPTYSGGMTVSISKVVKDVWTKNQTAMAFGNLDYDTTNHIFTAKMYYVVDVGVADNTSTVWKINHTMSSLKRTGGTETLDNKVNTVFSKITLNSSSAEVREEKKKCAFGASNNTAYTKPDLGGGWLRVEYGIGTGGKDELGNPTDATGVTPIGFDTVAGSYSGSVTFTYTP